MKSKWVLLACTSALFSTAALAGEMNEEQKLFNNFDADNNGTISMEEAANNQQLTQEWINLDTNHDGKLEEAEFSRFEELKSSSGAME